MSLFRDRSDAGQQLASALQNYRDHRPIILGLARGGVVLAAEIARHLACEADVLVARKVGAPHQPEFGIGAVAPLGVQVSDPRSLSRLGITSEQFDRLAGNEREEVDRRLATYRGSRLPSVSGRTTLVVDDGLATGVTAIAACRYVRKLNPARLVLAVPVCTAQAREALEPEVDDLVCLAQPEPFYSVGQWYDNFAQVEDDEVLDLLPPNQEVTP